jgi:hypothetical protein
MEKQLSAPVAAAGAAAAVALLVVSVIILCAGSGCAVAERVPDEVAAEDFPLALLLLDTRLAGMAGADGLSLEVCSAELTLLNDAPVAVDGVAVVGVEVVRASDGTLVVSLGGMGASPATVAGGAQVLIPLEAAGIGAVEAACGEELALAVVVAANGVVTTVRGHAVAVACP